jgi:putative transposase
LHPYYDVWHTYSMPHERAYCYRFYPTPEQDAILSRTFGCTRFVYNWGLKLRTDAWSDRQERVNYEATSAALTALKKAAATEWLNEVSSVPLQQALRHLDRAFRNFFEGRARYPVFKKKRNRQAATYATSAFTWDGATRSLKLAKMDAPLAIVWSRDMPKDARPSTVTVTRDASGRYFVSILIAEDIKPKPVTPKMVGIDLGLHDTVTLSTGEKVGNQRFFQKDAKQLAHAQRDLARKKPGSKNREKQRRTVAKIHATIADRRTDFLHKLTTRLIHENQVICVESLAVKNLLRNHSLAKAIADVGWGELIRQLEYKAVWYGRTLVAIDRFYPSSTRCHVCGHVLESLSLDVREWECPTCHTLHDRDINAALNILAAGLAVLACGEGVRPGRSTIVPAAPREAGTSRKRSLESPGF